MEADSGLRMAEGRVDIETDSAMAQLGVDLLRARSALMQRCASV